MKVTNSILSGLLITFLCITNLHAQIFISEGFEGTSSLHTPPANWVPDSNSDFWYFQNGGYDSGTSYHHPSNAHGGSYNAMFKTFGVATSKLVLPAVDLRFSVKPVLTFWHAQELRASINDRLKVFYRLSPVSPWVQLESYVNPTSGWVEREIILPDLAKTQTCQIALEGSSQNVSWGVCVDDILLEEKGNLPRQVESLSLIQNNYFIPSNSNTNPLGIISIDISGNTGNQPLKSVSINYTGTDINNLNINNSELFYTRDTIFSTKIKLNPTISNTGNTIIFSNINYNLQTGENYIWVCISVKPTATHNNLADFNLLQNSINIGDILFPEGTIAHNGVSTIEESVFFDGFESSVGWQFSPGSCWQMGVPTGAGTFDTDFSFSGLNVLATNLSGNYPAGIRPSSPQTATSPTFNAKFYQGLNVRFKRWLNFEYFDKTSIQCSVDGGTTWTNLWESNTTIQEQNWKSLSYNISSLATRKQDVKIRFSIDSTDLTGLYGGWNIDNLAVTGDFIAKDLGVSGITSPVTHCGMTSAETVIVKIKNFGGATLSEPFDVGFSLDNGVTYTKETINQTILSEAEYTYTFTAKANLSQLGLRQLKFKTFLTGDEDASNDLFSTTLYVFPTVNYSYLNSFETSNGYWNPSGTNSTWAWGIPNATKIKTASDGTKGWVTNLKGSHANSEVSYLESPCFNFTSSEYPVFSFDYWVDAENGVDGFSLEYSIDGGTSWNPVPENSNHTLNWCTGSVVSALSSDGWTGTTATNYITAKTLLPTNIIGVSNVKFRFKFASDNINSFEGVAIDNIKIYELPYNVGFESLSSPVSGCLIGGGINPVSLVASVKNFGYRPLKVGLKVPMEIKLRSENIVKDTLAIGSIVNQNGSTTFTSTGTYNIITKGSHSLRLNTNFVQELDKSNDTLKTTLNVLGIPGYTLGADVAVPNPFPAAISVELDAGLNGIVPYNNYLWSTTETTRKITVTSYGTYSVTVTNENGCNASDAIDVIESTNDIEIISANGLDNACTYPIPVTPQITIKNNGPSGVGPSFSMKNIPLSIMIDGTVIVSETFTPSTDIASGNSSVYTFTNSINISTPKTYDIRIYSKINEDFNKSNDTLKLSTQVWGTPKINFPQDTIVSLNATSIVLDAGAGFQSYAWKNSSVTTQTFNVPSLNSAWYVATVTAFNSCGTNKDSVFINAKDLSVLDIESPFNAFCGNPVPKVAVRIKNSGKDDFASGSIIQLCYITPSESISQNFTLDAILESNSNKLLTFDNYVKLPLGEGFVRVTADIVDDPNPANDVFEKSVVKLTNPTVSFNPSPLYKVFGASEPYVFSPVYSSDVESYLWDNFSTDSLFVITGPPLNKSLQVVAFDGLNQIGCSDTASLTIIAEDMVVDAIKSPTNQCLLGSGIPIVITIANKGNFAYPAGTSYTIGINVDGVNYTSETKTLATNLEPDEQFDLTLAPVLDLTGKSTSNTQISVSTSIDANTNNNSLSKRVYATGFPIINLGSDRAVHAWSDTLRTGRNFNIYDWKLNTTSVGSDSIYVASQTGTYSVTVTDFYGCSSTDDVVLTFVVDDIALETVNKPITGCSIGEIETVKATVKNTGTEIIPNGKQLEIGFAHEGVIKKENFTLTSNLNAGQSRSFDLTNTMAFPDYKSYIDSVWVKMAGDMNSTNDTLRTIVEKKPPVSFNFGIDTIRVTGSDTTIIALAGFTSYLWNTGAITQSIPVTTAGNYWVELTNSYGCTGRDTVYVKFKHDLKVNSIIAPQNACALSATETITIKLENTGMNEIPNGTVIQLILKINSVTAATENYTLTSNLAIGGTKDYSFTYKPNLSTVGNYLIEISAQMASDVVSTNNSVSNNIAVYGNPAPNLGIDRTISTPTILDAGSGYTLYTWQDGSHNQTFTANATNKYTVTVIDANGCQGYDEVDIIWQEVADVRISQLIAPTTSCFNALGQTVIARLTNMGSKTFNSGDNINVSYQVGTETPVVETMNFTSSFANNQSINYTFNQKALINQGAVTMYLKTIVSGNSGQTASFPVTINSKPNLNLGSDTIRTLLPYVLTSGISGVTYLWSTGSTNPSISVSTYGKYKLTVTGITTSCTAKDSVVIHWPVGVETIPGTNAKITLFPNPVNDELNITIETDKTETFSIDFINPQGQIVKNLKTDNTSYFKEKININNYSPGIYFIKVSNSKGFAVFKVVVEK
ncbi:MAG: T9SS type A sorting domain-containing protein [Bacteroidales bacterium]|nr:T9SS type A sorting domain-containing protein [Bacteroidales bacterium]